MKKLLLLLTAAFLVANYSFAQYKPAKGSVSTEVQFNPFDQDGKTFKLDGVKVRYFFTDVDAFRLKLGFGMRHDNLSASDDTRENENSNSDYFSVEDKYKTTSGDVELNLGYERHFDLSKRLSVYVGASVGFNRHFALTRGESIETRHYLAGKYWNSDIISQEESKISNGTFTELPEIGENDNPLDKVNNRANWEIKAALFTGVDFYVYKGLFLGTEFGLGMNSLKSSKMKFESTSSESDKMVTFESKDEIRNTKVGFYIEPTLRLGWTF